MKKKVLFSIALAGLMLGACSKDAIDNGGNGASWNENGTGFISFDLNIPSVNDGSRAEQEYPDFDDGENKEYEVKDAYLFLFTKGANDPETSAVFHSIYPLTFNGGNKPNEQITTSKRIVSEIAKIDGAGQEVYALVVLNYNNVFTVQATESSVSAKLQVGTKIYGIDESETITFDALNTEIAKVAKTDNPAWNKNGFFMSNATLYNKAGGDTSPTDGTSSTLVKIDTKKIFPTPQQASEQSAASIYVERAQAKIQVNDGDAENKIEIKDEFGKVLDTYYYDLTSWCIDNYNTQSYLTRKFDNNWAVYTNEAITTGYSQYRFVDSRLIDPNRMVGEANKRYRTYWGVDVNYDESNEIEGCNLTKLGPDFATNYATAKKDIGKSGYCFENTSAIDNTGIAAPGGLTRVIIEAKLKKDKIGTATHFFTERNDHSFMYIYDNTFADGKYKDGTIQKKIVGFIMMADGVKNVILEKGISDEDFNLVVDFPKIDGPNMVSGPVKTKGDITVTVKTTATTVPGWKEALQKAVDDALGTTIEGVYSYNIDLDFYKNGVSYYQTYIRHFNDSEAPLYTNAEHTAKVTVSDANLLGRYGVLRNNWYVLSVNKISAIGDSVYPEFPENPDEDKFYISVDINILAWAKREQNVDL